MTPPLGFSKLTLIPGPNANELPPITVSTFTATTPENTPLTHRASTSANPDPMISPAFVEANYEVLESLLMEQRKQIHNKDLRTELEYLSEEYDEEKEMEPRHVCIRETTPVLYTRSPRARRQREMVVEFEDTPNRDGSRVEWKSKGGRPSEHRVDDNKSSYDGKGDPDNYRHLFEGAIRMQKWAMAVAYHMYTDDTLQILGLHEEQLIFGFVHGLRTRSLVEFLSTDLPTTYKGLMEKTYTWIEAREVVTNGTPNDHREGSDRFKKNSS
ncbi:hypothetical protein Tco_0468596 [Tanacetum coccineum]